MRISQQWELLLERGLLFFNYICLSGLLGEKASHSEDSVKLLSSLINFLIKELFMLLSGLSARGEQPLHEDKSLVCHWIDE